MAPVACRPTGWCPLSVVEYGCKAGRKPATCRACGKTSRNVQAFFQFRFRERYHHRFRQESQISVYQRRRALDFLVCGAINEPHLPTDGSIPNQFLCVRCDQKVLATRKHELWECLGNTLIHHTHMKESEYLTSLAHEFWDTD